jgi:hypothetical protein
VVPEFVLQFPIEEVRGYASRFPSAGDDDVVAIGELARARGFYTRDEFVAVCRWKTPRSAARVAMNSSEDVERATRVALVETSAEAERMEALRSLHGVDWATASVLLHLVYPERYPIIDRRALHALGAHPRGSYSYGFWQEYVDACVRLAAEAGVDGRTFDQALWQWSKEQDSGPY